jgi:hypothetical protein
VLAARTGGTHEPFLDLGLVESDLLGDADRRVTARWRDVPTSHDRRGRRLRAHRRTIAEFVAHYHGERNHHGIGNELIQPLGRADGQGPVRCRQWIDGILTYHRAA